VIKRAKGQSKKKSQKFSLLTFHFSLKIGGERGIDALSLSLIAPGWTSQPGLKRAVALRGYACALRAFDRTGGSHPENKKKAKSFHF